MKLAALLFSTSPLFYLSSTIPLLCWLTFYISHDEYIYFLSFNLVRVRAYVWCKETTSMQFLAQQKRGKSRAKSDCEVAAVSPNKNPSWNKGEQNVSFDLSAPGPGWRFQEIFQALFLVIRLLHNVHLMNIKKYHSQVKWTTDCIDVERRTMNVERKAKCLFIRVIKWIESLDVCAFSYSLPTLKLPWSSNQNQPPEEDAVVVNGNYKFVACISESIKFHTSNIRWLAARVDCFMERTLLFGVIIIEHKSDEGKLYIVKGMILATQVFVCVQIPIVAPKNHWKQAVVCLGMKMKICCCCFFCSLSDAHNIFLLCCRLFLCSCRTKGAKFHRITPALVLALARYMARVKSGWNFESFDSGSHYASARFELCSSWVKIISTAVHYGGDDYYGNQGLATSCIQFRFREDFNLLSCY